MSGMSNGPSVRSTSAVRTLLVGMALLMVGNGLQASVLGVRAEIEGFGFAVGGAVMAGYFVGFLFGTAVAERFLAAVGHIRVFAALASTASSAAILHAVWVNPVTWALLRLVFGLCLAGLYVVVESWLNDMATNANRGRIMAGYMVVMMGGLGVGQLLLVGGDPAGFELFILVSVLVSLALVPITLSATTAPPVAVPEPLSLRRLVSVIPTGAVTAFWAGAATARSSVSPPSTPSPRASPTAGSRCSPPRRRWDAWCSNGPSGGSPTASRDAA